MEDYQAAFLHRFSDTDSLHTSGRKIAAMHFGGVTVECLLKSMVLKTLPPGTTPEWKTSSTDPGHSITNPGHSFVEALKRHNRLYSRVQRFQHVMKWIEAVENPGSHFIDMRYSCNDPDEAVYKQWFANYSRLLQWLQKQATTL